MDKRTIHLTWISKKDDVNEKKEIEYLDVTIERKDENKNEKEGESEDKKENSNDFGENKITSKNKVETINESKEISNQEDKIELKS